MSKYTAVNVGAVGDGAVSFNVIGVPPQTQGARPYTADQDKWLWNRAMAVAHAAWCKSLSARKSRDKWAVVKALRDTYSFQRTTFVLNWLRENTLVESNSKRRTHGMPELGELPEYAVGWVTLEAEAPLTASLAQFEMDMWARELRNRINREWAREGAGPASFNCKRPWQKNFRDIHVDEDTGSCVIHTREPRKAYDGDAIGRVCETLVRGEFAVSVSIVFP